MRRDFSPRRAALDQDRREGRCFTCGTKGHLARDCPDRDRRRDRGGRGGRYDDRDPSSEYGGRRGGGRRDDRRDRGYYDDYRGGHSRSPYSPRGGDREDKYYDDRRGGGDRGYGQEGRQRKARDYGGRGGDRTPDDSYSRDSRMDQRKHGRDEPPRGRDYSEERKMHEADKGYQSAGSPRGPIDEPKDKQYWPYQKSLDELHHDLDIEEREPQQDRIYIMVHFTNSKSAACAEMDNDLQDLGHLIGKRMLLFTVDVDRCPDAAKYYECDTEAAIPTFIAFNGRSITERLVRPDFKLVEKLVYELSGYDKETHDRARSPPAEEKALPPAGDDYGAGDVREQDDRRDENPEVNGDH